MKDAPILSFGGYEWVRVIDLDKKPEVDDTLDWDLDDVPVAEPVKSRIVNRVEKPAAVPVLTEPAHDEVREEKLALLQSLIDEVQARKNNPQGRYFDINQGALVSNEDRVFDLELQVAALQDRLGL